jgi:hypothetical protein
MAVLERRRPRRPLGKRRNCEAGASRANSATVLRYNQSGAGI